MLTRLKTTLEGNALLKALAVSEATGLAALADDTGLEVDALDGRPGVFSARFAGPDATYEQNVDRLLADLDGVRTPVGALPNGDRVCGPRFHAADRRRHARGDDHRRTAR